MYQQNQTVTRSSNPAAVLLTLGGLFLTVIVGLTLIFGSWYTNDQGERAVVTRNGAVVDETGPGLHFKMPWIESIERFEVRTQKLPAAKIAVYSSDIQPANVTMSLNYHLLPDKVKEIYSNLGTGFSDRVVTPNVLRISKEVFGKFAAADIINRRDQLGATITENLQKELAPYGIAVEAVQIENIDFSDAFEKSVEARMQAEIEVKKREQQLRTTEIEAQQAAAKAKGEADAVKAQADGDAYATLTNAKAEAQAIQIKNDALRANPAIIEYTKAQRWDGKLPSMMMGGSVTPMLDLREK